MRIPVIVFHEDADLNPNRGKDGRFGFKAAVDPAKAAKTKLSLQRSELKAMERKREEVTKAGGSEKELARLDLGLSRKREAIKATQDLVERMKAEPVKPKEPENPKGPSLESLQVPQAVKDKQGFFPDLPPDHAQAIKDAPLMMRVPTSALGGIAENGFLNQHQIRKSGGKYDPKLRKEFEDGMMGVNSSNPEDYPKYGYLDFSKASKEIKGDYMAGDKVDQYGLIGVEFKPHVKERTTISFGDSLDEMRDRLRVAQNQTSYGGTELKTPEQKARFSGSVTPLLAPKNTEWERANGPRANPSSRGYTEAQIYGSLGTSDIASIRVFGKAQAEKASKLYPGVEIKPHSTRLGRDFEQMYAIGNPQHLTKLDDRALDSVANSLSLVKWKGSQAWIPGSVPKDEWEKLPKETKVQAIKKHLSSMEDAIAKAKADGMSQLPMETTPGMETRKETLIARKETFKEISQGINKGKALFKELGELYDIPVGG